MERIVTYAVILLVAVNAASALSCYRCLASPTSDCSEGASPSMIVTPCDPVTRNATTMLNSLIPMNESVRADEIEIFCVAYSGLDGGIGFFERGCGFIYTGVDICEYIGALVKLDTCISCRTDLCL